MTTYQPAPGTLETIRGHRGWYIYDKHGLYDGPYSTAADAFAVIRHIEQRKEAA